jgi:hypothetical protein
MAFLAEARTRAVVMASGGMHQITTVSGSVSCQPEVNTRDRGEDNDDSAHQLPRQERSSTTSWRSPGTSRSATSRLPNDSSTPSTRRVNWLQASPRWAEPVTNWRQDFGVFRSVRSFCSTGPRSSDLGRARCGEGGSWYRLTWNERVPAFTTVLAASSGTARCQPRTKGRDDHGLGT